MPIITQDMKPVLVKYICDTCGGEMRRKHGGKVFYTDPLRYEHVCWQTMLSDPDKRCEPKMLEAEYPYIDYVPV